MGLGKKGMPLKGLEEAKQADVVYAEFYTSATPGLSPEELGELLGRRVEVVNRKTLEEAPGEILRRAKDGRVVLLVPGDPMVATTHVDLRLRAEREGIRTRLIHAGSILSAVAGLSGLQSYKFGPLATVPFPDNPSPRPYEVLAENKARGLHTLLLLDFRAEENRAMLANQALELMLGLERKYSRGVFSGRTLAVVIARAGAEDVLVKASRAGELLRTDFGPPPHSLVVPGKLHFMEAEALKILAGAPEGAVNELLG
jgi:diphthine synthase